MQRLSARKVAQPFVCAGKVAERTDGEVLVAEYAKTTHALLPQLPRRLTVVPQECDIGELGDSGGNAQRVAERLIERERLLAARRRARRLSGQGSEPSRSQQSVGTCQRRA